MSHPYTFYRYVQPTLVSAYQELGWMDLGPTAGHHGVHAHTMVLEGSEDPPPEPGVSSGTTMTEKTNDD